MVINPLSRGGTFLVTDLIEKSLWNISHQKLEIAKFDPAKWYQEKLSQVPDTEQLETPPIIYEWVQFSDFVQGSIVGI